MSENIMDRAGTLVLHSVESDVTVWQDEGEDEVYYSNDDGRVLIPYTSLPLHQWWTNYRAETVTWMQGMTGFTTWLEERVIDPSDVADMQWCNDCAEPGEDDEMCSTNDGQVCESCIDDYWTCYHCADRYKSTTTIDDDTEVCSACLSSRYSFCESCDRYYYSANGEGCNNEDHGGCDCESPAQSFRIRNDGHGPLSNDSVTTVTLPAGVISDEGIGEISNAIRNHGYALYLTAVQAEPEDRAAADVEYGKWRVLSYDLAAIGVEWQRKEGNYTKRLSRHAYKNHQLKVPPSVISEVGNIASAHSRAADLRVAMTRALNGSAEDFAHEESCWWQSYYHGRCALKSNGGFGMRTFTERTSYQGHTYEGVDGRAWVLPVRLVGDASIEQARRKASAADGCNDSCCVIPAGVREFVPTFDTEGADAFIVFNGYGNLEGYTAARVLAHMVGMTYRKVGFVCEPMYVNSESGYLVAPEEIAERYTDGSIRMRVDQHSDLHANESIESKELSHA